jgi:folate-binding protein YgfZ
VAGKTLSVPEETLREMSEHGNLRAAWSGRPAIVTRVSDMGVPGFDLFVEVLQSDALKRELLAAGAVEVDSAAAAAIRIESGVPLFHRDMDEETIPLEAGIESRAISFTKGCYVGQEIVARGTYVGQVRRKLLGLRVEGDLVPSHGDRVSKDGHEVGRVTSAAWSPSFRRVIALGILRLDAVSRDDRLSIDHGGQDLKARMGSLPFS